ncbi:MAG: hypothetical protein K2L88_00880, partial [Clostridiales bacterium]|nr:hypothetical protein [Clostridiales bacterium]
MNKRRQKIYIGLLVSIIILGIALTVALGVFLSKGGLALNKGEIRSETLYVILFLFVLLPVALVGLIVAAIFQKKKVTTVEGKLEGSSSNHSAVPTKSK